MSYTQNFDLGEDWRLLTRAFVEVLEESAQDAARAGQEKLVNVGRVAWGNLAANIGHDPVEIKDDRIRVRIGVAKTSRTMHAWPVEAGLKPGRARPLAPFIQWAEQVVGGNEDAVRAAAVSAWRSVMRRGTQGAFFMRDALEIVAEPTQHKLEAAMASVFS